MTFDPRELALAGVRGLQPYQPGKPIEELEREYGVRNAIKLASNENPLGPGPMARAAIERALGDVSRYPDGAGTALKLALAERLGLSPQQVTLGNGSNDILELVARTFVSPGDEVLFSQHAFAVYPIVTQAVGGTAVVTPARDWGYDLDAMCSRLSPRTKLVFIANPNNPTGTWLSGAAIEGFLERLPPRIIVVLDEAYVEYMEDKEAGNSLAWLAHYPNLVITRTFSKAYGLAGLRIGYGLSSAAIADLFNRVRQPFNVNNLGQTAALAALDDRGHLELARRVNREGMQQLTEGFARMGLDYIPSVANFISVRLPRPGLRVYEALLREGVIARPVANYGMPDHLRVTIGLREENARFLAALERVLAQP